MESGAQDGQDGVRERGQSDDENLKRRRGGRDAGQEDLGCNSGRARRNAQCSWRETIEGGGIEIARQ